MRSTWPRLLMALLLAYTIGAHWAVLQSIAWARMVIDYSAEGGFKEALQKTFDGKHPCALCKRIAGGKRSEKRTEFRLDSKKFEFSHLTTTFIFRAPAYFWEVDAPASSPKDLTHSPPSPPPRLLPV